VIDKDERLAIARQFGVNLRRERRHAGYSQAELASISGLHSTEISLSEASGRRASTPSSG
jgi:transcriptional regulator with XRE-family HTH domain